jgi:hypothetical protein
MIPCIVKNCVSGRSLTSGYGYCAIHHAVACNPVLFAQALSSQVSQNMKAFAEDIERGIYPKGV